MNSEKDYRVEEVSYLQSHDQAETEHGLDPMSPDSQASAPLSTPLCGLLCSPGPGAEPLLTSMRW